MIYNIPWSALKYVVCHGNPTHAHSQIVRTMYCRLVTYMIRSSMVSSNTYTLIYLRIEYICLLFLMLHKILWWYGWYHTYHHTIDVRGSFWYLVMIPIFMHRRNCFRSMAVAKKNSTLQQQQQQQ